MEFEKSPVSLELLQYHHPVDNSRTNISTPNQMGFRHLALQVDNIEKEVERLEKEGVKFFSKIQTNPYGKKMCYFDGPDGIVIEILEL
jgi:catechol 2,3-dioxygenase-like lactoylglutathione lyase family enzyme